MNESQEILLDHFARGREQRMVGDALEELNSFRTSARCFYDLDNLDSDDPMRMGETPKNLVSLLNGFVQPENRLDVNKLSYEGVREDYKKRTSLKNIGLILGGLPLFLGGVGGALEKYIQGNNFATLIDGVIAVFGAGSMISGLKRISAPHGTNGEYPEYKRLLEAAKSADAFLKEKCQGYQTTYAYD